MQGIRAQLPTNIALEGLERLASDPNWGWHRKYNGDRRTIKKEAGRIQDFNRDGKVGKGLPKNIMDALLSHPLPQFLIDVEFVHFGGHDTIYIFDALILGDEFVAVEEFEYREARYHAEFDNFAACIVPVFTARTQEEKIAMFVQAKQDGCEGIVAHNMRASYEEGRSENVWKFKFVKDCDVVVLGPSRKGHDSVDVGVYNEQGKLFRVCGCKNKNDFSPHKGDVVIVKYLSASRNYHLIQPRLVARRDDKQPKECTIDQLVKNEGY